MTQWSTRAILSPRGFPYGRPIADAATGRAPRHLRPPGRRLAPTLAPSPSPLSGSGPHPALPLTVRRQRRRVLAATSGRQEAGALIHSHRGAQRASFAHLGVRRVTALALTLAALAATFAAPTVSASIATSAVP